MSSEKYTLVENGIVIAAKLSADIDEPCELFLDASAVGRTDDRDVREAKTRQILKLLDESNIANEWYDGRQQADLEVQIGFTRRGYGVFGMTAEIDWPSVSDDEASEAATLAMQNMARNLGIYPTKEISGMVYAQVSRSHGITLETNPAGSSSMDTDGQDYEPGSGRVELHAHNLYAHEMQLICISGLIALAKAR